MPKRLGSRRHVHCYCRKRVKRRAGSSDSLFGAPKAAEKKSLGDLFGSADTSTGALPEPTGAERCQLQAALAAAHSHCPFSSACRGRHASAAPALTNRTPSSAAKKKPFGGVSMFGSADEPTAKPAQDRKCAAPNPNS